LLIVSSAHDFIKPSFNQVVVFLTGVQFINSLPDQPSVLSSFCFTNLKLILNATFTQKIKINDCQNKSEPALHDFHPL